MKETLVREAALLSATRQLTKREQIKKLRELTEGMTFAEKTRFYTLVYIEMNKILREQKEKQ